MYQKQWKMFWRKKLGASQGTAGCSADMKDFRKSTKNQIKILSPFVSVKIGLFLASV